MGRLLRVFVISLLTASMFPISSAMAAEYCYTKYQDRIGSANGELKTILDRISAIEPELNNLRTQKDKAASDIATLAVQDPSSPRIQELANSIREADKEVASLASETFDLQDRAAALKSVIPADLAGELRGCVEASRPASQFVNLTIQTLAILSTSGASLLLPEKALYVDMSAVLNGYPLGGPNSFVVKGRNDAAAVLGIDLENDNGFIGNAVKNPLQPWKW